MHTVLFDAVVNADVNELTFNDVFNTDCMRQTDCTREQSRPIINSLSCLCRYRWFCSCGRTGCGSSSGCPLRSCAGYYRMGNQNALRQFRQMTNAMKWDMGTLAYLAEHLSVIIKQKSCFLT